MTLTEILLLSIFVLQAMKFVYSMYTDYRQEVQRNITNWTLTKIREKLQ